ncbi:receptor-type tyrosine-protein phosphatase T-like [Haliotis asinina]|uniref:receptor-type tyrosine-protein phosphatase T-like n=1 Tax=Haliotis asinina TaxID=109174 RepID=UPI00353241BF
MCASVLLADTKDDPECTNDVDSNDYASPVYASGVVSDKKDGRVPVSVVDSDDYLNPESASSVVVDVDKDDNDTYYNTAPVPAVTLVSVDQLQERILELQVPVGGFQAEYETGCSSDDDTRVRLQTLPDKPGSDYINASYIDGYSNPKVYIAAQGPHTKPLTDFWRLIWEKNCTRIVMLTNLVEMGKTKCAAYWPDKNDLTVGDFRIAVISSSERAHWVVRELQVTEKKTRTCRCFHHFHFITWPDHWILEETSLAEFLWLVRTAANTHDGPLLLHCSAGIGRTGTYIAVDYLLDQALAHDKVDVFACVSKMRDQRKGMIQTKEQYSCVYLTLQEALEFGNTTMDMQEFSQNRNEKQTFKMGCMEPTQLIEILNVKRETSRIETKLRGRLYVDGRTDIVALELESHLSLKGYLLTEAPSVTTALLFWKLMEQQESATVIVLPDSHQNLSSYVPSPGNSLNLRPITVKCSTQNTINHNIVLRIVHMQIDVGPQLLYVNQADFIFSY